MIILSPTFALTLPYDVPPGTPLIGWHNLVTRDNVAASSAEASFPVANLANPSTVLRWRSTSTAEQFITVTLNSPIEIDYFAVARHNFASAGIAISIEGLAEVEGSPIPDVDWFDLTEPVMLANDAPLLFRFEKQSLQGIRLRMPAGTAPATVAVVYVGVLLVMERGITIDSSPTPLPFGRKTTVITGRSEAGDFLGRITTGSSVEGTADFAHLRPSWYRSKFQPFVDAAVDGPFFYAWNPLEYPDEVGFAALSADPAPTLNPVTRRMAVQLQMRGILR